MDYKQKWQVIAALDGGGQGKVYRVCNKKEYLEIKETITEALRQITSGFTYYDPERKEGYDLLREWLPKMLRMEDPVNQFALKVLHEPLTKKPGPLPIARDRPRICAKTSS